MGGCVLWCRVERPAAPAPLPLRSEEMFEEVYEYYARGSSYALMPGAADALARIRSRGIKTAVVRACGRG